MADDPILRLETDANVLAAIKHIRERGERNADMLALCDWLERRLAWEAKHGRRPKTLEEMAEADGEI